MFYCIGIDHDDKEIKMYSQYPAHWVSITEYEAHRDFNAFAMCCPAGKTWHLLTEDMRSISSFIAAKEAA